MKTLNLLLSIFGALAAVVFVAQLVRGSEQPWKLVAKAVASLAVISVYLFLRDAGPFGKLFSIAAFFGMAFLWWSDVGDLLGGIISSGMTGGSQQVDKTALLSRVESLRKTNRHEEALEEAHLQLKRFKNDFDCYMLIASIQAEDMKNLPIAASLLEGLLASNKKLERKQVVYALNTLADWHLKFGRDPDSARACLNQIVELFPDSRAAQSANSRIAHLVDRATLEAADRPKEAKVMPKFERDIGLRGLKPQLVKEFDRNAVTDQYLAQLEAHPEDWESREKLAAHYIEHYANVPCAIEEIEILMKSRLATKDDRCRWLHMIADWQVRVGRDAEAARATLKRIIEKYPGTAHASRAEQAMHYLQTGNSGKA